MVAAFKQHQFDESEHLDDGSEGSEVDFEEMEDCPHKDDELNGVLLQEGTNYEDFDDRHKAAFVGFQKTNYFSHTSACVEVIRLSKSQKRVLGRVHKIVSKVYKSSY
uniref:Uncharacterized protein n=1 Tax=Amphimedon queenslandica TaxID=400682 RepID=A0A1X7VS18_AMPQE